jgi:hypothetical protein
MGVSGRHRRHTSSQNTGGWLCSVGCHVAPFGLPMKRNLPTCAVRGALTRLLRLTVPADSTGQQGKNKFQPQHLAAPVAVARKHRVTALKGLGLRGHRSWYNYINLQIIDSSRNCCNLSELGRGTP